MVQKVGKLNRTMGDYFGNLNRVQAMTEKQISRSGWGNRGQITQREQKQALQKLPKPSLKDRVSRLFDLFKRG
jgi:hypothetical protein